MKFGIVIICVSIYDWNTKNYSFAMKKIPLQDYFIKTQKDTNLLAEINQFKDIFLPLFSFKRYSEKHQFPKKNTLVKIIISIYYSMMIS